MQHYSTRFLRRTVVGGLTAVAAVALLSGVGQAAEKFPSKTIEVVTHASAGGGTDTTARIMMIRGRRYLKTDMVVVQKRGGGGEAAQSYANKQPKDGHTVLALTQTHLYTIALGKSPLKIDDLVGVARAMDDPTFIVVHKDSPYKTFKQLIEAQKTKALTWAVAQIAGTEHIGAAQLAEAAGIPMKNIKAAAFGSGGKMVAALMSKAADVSPLNVSESLSQIEEGVFRPLAVMGPTRLKAFPDVPTTFERGYKVKCTTTRGYAVLKGTPQDRIDTLSKAFVKAMGHDTFGNYLKASGLDPAESVAGSKVWDAALKEEYANAAKALKMLGLVK